MGKMRVIARVRVESETGGPDLVERPLERTGLHSIRFTNPNDGSSIEITMHVGSEETGVEVRSGGFFGGPMRVIPIVSNVIRIETEPSE